MNAWRKQGGIAMGWVYEMSVRYADDILDELPIPPGIQTRWINHHGHCHPPDLNLPKTVTEHTLQSNADAAPNLSISL